MKKQFIILSFISSLFLLSAIIISILVSIDGIKKEKKSYIEWVAQSIKSDIIQKTDALYAFIEKSVDHESFLLKNNDANAEHNFEVSLLGLTPNLDSVIFFKDEEKLNQYMLVNKNFYAEAVLAREAFSKTDRPPPVLIGVENNRHFIFAKQVIVEGASLGVVVMSVNAAMLALNQFPAGSNGFIDISQEGATIIALGDNKLRDSAPLGEIKIEGTSLMLSYWARLPGIADCGWPIIIIAIILIFGLLAATAITYRKINNSIKFDMAQLFISIKSIMEVNRYESPKQPSLELPESYSLYMSLLQIKKNRLPNKFNNSTQS